MAGASQGAGGQGISHRASAIERRLLPAKQPRGATRPSWAAERRAAMLVARPTSCCSGGGTLRAHTERELDAEVCARGAHRAEKRRRWEVVLRRQHAHRAHRPARVRVAHAALVGVMVRHDGGAPTRPRDQALLRLTTHHEHILPTKRERVNRAAGFEAAV